MKRISAIVILAASMWSAVAQTNMVATNTATRTLSLQDCFTEALRHNFDLQIERYAPEISLYGLRGSYGTYDPTFTFSATHKFSTGDTTTNVALIGTNSLGLHRDTARDNNLASDLGGSLPWGMTYDLVGNVDEGNNTAYFGPTNFNSALSRNSQGSAEVDLTQPLLKDFWIDNPRMTIRQAKNALKKSKQALRKQLIATVSDVENGYFELIYARDFVKVQQEALDLAQTQLDQDRQRVQVGSLAPLDVQQDEAQVAQNRASLITAQFALVKAQNALKELITDNYAQWHDVDITPAAPMEAVRQFFDLQDSWSKGMTQRPDLLEARLDVENQGITLEFDKNQLFPTLDLKGTFGYAGNGYAFGGALGEIHDQNRPYYSYGATLSMPLSNVRARNTLKSDRANLQQLLLTLKQLEQSIMVEIDNAVKQAESTWEGVQATHEGRIYAEAALDAEQKKYNVGKSTTFTVLQLQNKLTTARSQEIRAVADYNEALANLAQQEGSTLERRQIDFN
ncbi:MAG: TolC family protein [Verrucomicrobiae bacterium]|nr:TolC family protein [Verrucomicrobiae bacterium]